MRTLDDALRRLDRVLDGGVLVALVERLRAGEGVVDLVEVGGGEAFVPALVQRKPRVDEAVAPVDGCDDLLRAAHLRDACRVHEAHSLDPS